MNSKEIGRRIKSKREQLGLTLQDVATKVGVAKSTIQRYESGLIENIKLPVISSIATTLNVNPMWLIGKSDNENLTYDKKTAELIRLNEYALKIHQNTKYQDLIKAFDSLYLDNQDKVLLYCQNLLKIQEQEDALLNAAHAIDGATEEEKQHDSD